MLEFPGQRNQSHVLDITNADTISAVRAGDSQQGRDRWVQEKQAELLSALPPSGGSLRITPALRRALVRFSCIAPKGTTHVEACARLARAMRDGVAERVLLQERAARALWVLCSGNSDQEAFIRYVLGKAGGVGALMDLMEHSTARAAEFAIAAMLCAVEDNISNRLLFQDAGGLSALCRLLREGNTGAQEHAIATLRVMIDTSRRSGKSGGPGGRSGAVTARERTVPVHADDAEDRRPATSRAVDRAASSATAFSGAGGDGEEAGRPDLEVGVEGLCREALSLGVMDSLVALLQSGSPRSKAEAAMVVRHMSVACPDCRDSAAPSGALAGLVRVLGAEGGELPEHAAAALGAVCAGHAANVRALRSDGGMAALTRVLALPFAGAQEQACAVVLAVLEADPPCAFDLGEKGKDCIRRLASADGPSAARLRALAGRALQMMRMILSSPGVFLAPRATPGTAPGGSRGHGPGRGLGGS